MRPVLLLVPVLLAACAREPEPLLRPLPLPPVGAGTAEPRVSGPLGAPDAPAPPLLSYGREATVTPPGAGPPAGGGDISLNFADTDIREVASQILGGLLGVTYAIDPGVRGTATLRTAQPVTRAQLLPILQTLLNQNGASVVQTGGIYRVLATGAAGAAGGGAPAPAAGLAEAGATVVPLRYASAEELARVLQPFVAGGARITPDPSRNALLVAGDPATRDTLLGLVRSFDVDVLAGQSYALLPVSSGDAKDFATAMQDALRGSGAQAGVVRVVPMQRINAVLVASGQRGAIDQARRVFGLVERARRQTVRGWHVYYLQNSRANDIAYVLQQAFTPRSVTAQPTPQGAGAPGRATRQLNGGAGSISGTGGAGLTGGAGGLGGGLGGSGGGLGGSGLGGGGPGGGGSGGGLGSAGLEAGGDGNAGAQAAGASGGNPLLGGLDPGGGAEAAPDAMRIIPNPQNNALLIYATPQERDTIETTLRRLDVLPLQVRIDAVIAEVTLNDSLRYGTQFFFNTGNFTGALSIGATAVPALAFPGFVLTGGGPASAAPFAISALQAVTDVRVLSSPQLMVLDNESARLQVGQLVPFLSQTAQSTLSAGAPIVSSVGYRETGVIMEVTPRVNSGGLVTLDIAQEVSDVDPTQTTPGLNSPTFLERTVRSRVAVQDGQTIGLAGLIRDNVQRGNQGIPWLRNIPILGNLVSEQNNNRQRTELLVLITPRVIHDQRDARALTEDLRDSVLNAAAVPDQLNNLPLSGLPDPSGRARRRLGLSP